MANTGTDQPTFLPPRERFWVAVAIVPCGSMQGMDTFAVSVALPIMQGSFCHHNRNIMGAYVLSGSCSHFHAFFGWASRKVGARN